MKLITLILLLLPLTGRAQHRYCQTFQDYMAARWQPVTAPLQLVSSASEDPLALEPQVSDRKLRQALKRCFALEYNDSLYINLRRFNRFGDVFVRAWRMGSDKLVFARPVIGYNEQMDVTFNLNSRMGKKMPFQEYNTLKDLVCYIVAWDPQREELRLGRIKPSADADEALRQLRAEDLIR